MNFDPLSEDEVSNLVPDGIYDFIIKYAEDTFSQSGNQMIKLKLAIINKNNQEKIILDYLLPSLMYKVKHFADATGLEEKYNLGGYVALDCLEKYGKCKIGKQEASNGFPPKNIVKDYIKKDAIVKDISPFKDDDLPF